MPAHPSLRRAVFIALVAAALAPATASASARCSGAHTVPTAATLNQARHAVLCLLNHERTAHGLSRLHTRHQLRHAAQRFSVSMSTRRFFDHTSPSGSTPEGRIRATGYLDGALGWAIGENIGWGQGSLGKPSQMVGAWMRSAPHRANILSPTFHDVGVGLALGDPTGGDGVTYTTDFGVRR